MFLFEFYNIIFELKRQSGDITDVVSIFVTYIIFVQLILQSICNFRKFRSKYHKIVCHFKKRWPKIFYVSFKTLLKRIYDFSESKKESLLHIQITTLFLNNTLTETAYNQNMTFWLSLYNIISIMIDDAKTRVKLRVKEYSLWKNWFTSNIFVNFRINNCNIDRTTSFQKKLSFD